MYALIFYGTYEWSFLQLRQACVCRLQKTKTLIAEHKKGYETKANKSMYIVEAHAKSLKAS